MGWKFNFDNNEISLYDQKEGLYADCYIETETQLALEKIEERAKTFVENILNLIDFSTSSASNSALLISIYDATNGLEIRPFKQIFYIPLPEKNVNPINKEIFEEIFNKFNKNQDPRIVRAISWLRKGNLERDFVDKFISFWIGLESLNKLLCNFYRISQKDGNITSSAGIKELFRKSIDNGLGKFKTIRRARGKLVHGGGPLDGNFVAKIREYIPLVKKALMVGIGQLLGLDDKYIQQILERKTKLYTERLRIILEANIKNFTPPTLDEFGKQPKFDLSKPVLPKRTINKDGKLNLEMSSNFFVPRNATFDLKSIDLWGDDNTAIENARLLVLINHATKNLSTKCNR